jgi:hypothetical protein
MLTLLGEYPLLQHALEIAHSIILPISNGPALQQRAFMVCRWLIESRVTL